VVGLIFLLFFVFNINAEVFLDSYNRKIELNKTPQKIIAIGPGALRIVSYLDETDKLCGVENIEVKFPKGRPYAVAYYEKIKNLPIFGEGGPDKRPDYEKIINLNPDIIIVSDITDELLSEIQEKTRKKVFVIDYGSLGSFDTEKFKNGVIKLAKIFKKEKRAKDIIKKINGYLMDIKKRVKDKKEEKKVYVGGIGFKGSHGIVSTQIDYEPFKILGIKSIIDNLNKGKINHIFIDKETLAFLNPDVVFIDLGGVDIIQSDFELSPDYYGSISAFKNNNVYTTLPFNYYTTNVEIVFINAYFIGKILYPDSFKDIDIKKICSKIMKDFVGKDVCDIFMDNKNFYKKVIFKNGKFEYI